MSISSTIGGKTPLDIWKLVSRTPVEFFKPEIGLLGIIGKFYHVPGDMTVMAPGQRITLYEFKTDNAIALVYCNMVQSINATTVKIRVKIGKKSWYSIGRQETDPLGGQLMPPNLLVLSPFTEKLLNKYIGEEPVEEDDFFFPCKGEAIEIENESDGYIALVPSAIILENVKPGDTYAIIGSCPSLPLVGVSGVNLSTYEPYPAEILYTGFHKLNIINGRELLFAFGSMFSGCRAHVRVFVADKISTTPMSIDSTSYNIFTGVECFSMPEYAYLPIAVSYYGLEGQLPVIASYFTMLYDIQPSSYLTTVVPKSRLTYSTVVMPLEAGYTYMLPLFIANKFRVVADKPLRLNRYKAGLDVTYTTSITRGAATLFEETGDVIVVDEFYNSELIEDIEPGFQALITTPEENTNIIISGVWEI